MACLQTSAWLAPETWAPENWAPGNWAPSPCKVLSLGSTKYQSEQTVYANNVIYDEHLLFSEVLEIIYTSKVSHNGATCLYDWPQQKSWARRLGWVSLTVNTLHISPQVISGGIKYLLCDYTGQEHLEACNWCSPDIPSCAFAYLTVYHCNKPKPWAQQLLSPVNPGESVRPSWRPLTQAFKT